MAKSFKEKTPTRQGIDFEPKSKEEIKSQKRQNAFSKESDEEARLSGDKNLHYRREENKLGSMPEYDDYSEDADP